MTHTSKLRMYLFQNEMILVGKFMYCHVNNSLLCSFDAYLAHVFQIDFYLIISLPHLKIFIQTELTFLSKRFYACGFQNADKNTRKYLRHAMNQTQTPRKLLSVSCSNNLSSFQIVNFYFNIIHLEYACKFLRLTFSLDLILDCLKIVLLFFYIFIIFSLIFLLMCQQSLWLLYKVIALCQSPVL